MTEGRLTRLDLERFAYGEDDTHEGVILSDPEYLRELEEIWASELPRDLAPGILQAIRLRGFVAGTAGAVLDLGVAFGAAISHYLEASIGEPDEVDEILDDRRTDGPPNRPGT